MTLKQGQCCRTPVASLYTSLVRMRIPDVQGVICVFYISNNSISSSKSSHSNTSILDGAWTAVSRKTRKPMLARLY